MDCAVIKLNFIYSEDVNIHSGTNESHRHCRIKDARYKGIYILCYSLLIMFKTSKTNLQFAKPGEKRGMLVTV